MTEALHHNHALRGELALEELGPTPDVVADTLRLLGITGEREQVSRCIIAKYLQVKTGCRAWDVSVDYPDHIVWEATHLGDTLPIPKPVVEVIKAFDGGFLPEFIDDPEDRARFTPCPVITTEKDPVTA